MLDIKLQYTRAYRLHSPSGTSHKSCEIFNLQAPICLRAELRVFVKSFGLDRVSNTVVLGSSEKTQTTVKGQSQQSLVTIIDAVTAKGIYLEPGIIFKGEASHYQWFEEEMLKLLPGWHFTVSPNGWSSTEIAVFWVEKVLLPQMNKLRVNKDGTVDGSRPILLILDGHDSHRSIS